MKFRSTRRQVSETSAEPKVALNVSPDKPEKIFHLSFVDVFQYQLNLL